MTFLHLIWRTLGGTAGRGAAGSARMVGFDVHQTARDHQTKGWRKAKVPLGGARDQGGDLRRSDLQAGHQHCAHAIPAGSGESAQGIFALHSIRALSDACHRARFARRLAWSMRHNICATRYLSDRRSYVGVMYARSFVFVAFLGCRVDLISCTGMPRTSRIFCSKIVIFSQF